MPMKNYTRQLFWLILISAFVRAFFAAFVELGNDEVYYRIFALHPSWSYFDHPPMVAWLIRLTTLGGTEISELAVRQGAVIIGSINTYLIYRLAQGARTGFIAALLYTGSIYGSVILGTFILPDTPLTLFWLLTLLIFSRILPSSEPSRHHRQMLLAGALIGLAMLSKYSGAYLWGAAGLWILIFNRCWLKQWSLWVGGLITLLIFMPVLFWNWENDFISFTFHSARVTSETAINWLYFGREFMGGMLYNNPVNFVVIIMALISIRSLSTDKSERGFWILFSLPLIALFLGISLTRETLPHWAAPAYFALLIPASRYLNSIRNGIRWSWISVSFTTFVMVAGLIQINFGIIKLGNSDPTTQNIGRGDFSLDTYGWRQLGEKFNTLYHQQIALGAMPEGAALTQFGWDDAAHIDTYCAQPYGLTMKTLGEMQSLHHYPWITADRGGIVAGEDLFLVISSTFYRDPLVIYGDRFESIVECPSIDIIRSDRVVKRFYVYLLKGYIE